MRVKDPLVLHTHYLRHKSALARLHHVLPYISTLNGKVQHETPLIERTIIMSLLSRKLRPHSLQRTTSCGQMSSPE
ncbi:hypothetical protein CEXT_775431 [Caerostris extrusa]|uniref:Uncharacterized protein n=1 Tax=Caerostris extrusa TaxID=172846 RepID=A0AAV4QXY2_CAEEX|nr:hypothetical protein CEXT_775431 [Caerostris extrusa]